MEMHRHPSDQWNYLFYFIFIFLTWCSHNILSHIKSCLWFARFCTHYILIMRIFVVKKNTLELIYTSITNFMVLMLLRNSCSLKKFCNNYWTLGILIRPPTNTTSWTNALVHLIIPLHWLHASPEQVHAEFLEAKTSGLCSRKENPLRSLTGYP